MHGAAPTRAQELDERRHRAKMLAATAAVFGAAIVGAVTLSGGDEPATNSAGSLTISNDAGDGQAGSDALPDLALDDQDGLELIPSGLAFGATPATTVVDANESDACTIGLNSLRLNSSGDEVACLQEALMGTNLYAGPADGDFDDTTLAAVFAFQEANELFVDGVVGRETAIELSIWPDENAFVIRTPAPAPGAKDLWGVELSPVASAGDAAPPVPQNSGEGRRVVYDRAGQRVWAVGDGGQIIRSWLVSGSKFSNEEPGTHTVYSRSEMSTAWNGKAWLPMMIRYQRTDIGHIGFHSIPLHVSDDSPYQGTDELGTRLSGGCQRQHFLDASFMWGFATEGTTVVVL